MKNHCLYFVLGIASCLTLHWLPQQAQEPAGASASKIADLENRVQRLETIVYATSSLGTEEAQRRLANAKKTFEHSRKLQKKGFITEAQLQSDGFAVKQAESELKLAQGQSDEAKMGAELQLLNSEQALLRAQQQLEYTRKLAAKGFATSFDVQQLERRVRRIEWQLATAKRQAESLNPPVEKLESQKVD